MVVVVALGVLLAVEALSAARDLAATRDRARDLETQLAADDLGAARATAAALRTDAAHAHDRTDGPLWDLAGHLPVVGTTVRAVQASAAGADLVAREAVPAATRVVAAMAHGDLRPRHGRIALGPLRSLTPSVRRAATVLDHVDASLAAIDTQQVLGPVRSTFAHLQQQLGTAHDAADAASTALRVLPGMLGADGPRSWLLLVQNNAEIRATGGMAGSWAVVHTDHGHVRLGRQGADTDMPPLPRPAVRLPRDVRALYGSDLGTDFRDMNFDPDFPQVARMAAALLRRDHHQRVDGVVAVDPVALADVLRGTGPVPVRFQGRRTTLTADNVVPTLLNGVYRSIPDGQLQNAFFQAAARSVFHAVTSGRGDARALTRGMVAAAGQGRVLVWSRDHHEQDALGPTRVSGALPGGSGTPAVGVYLDDATATKMEFYLRVRSRVRATGCSAAGVQQLRTRVELRSVAPPHAARLSPYVTGPGTYAPRGSMRLNAWLYGPTAGQITSVRLDGHPVTVTASRQQDRQVTLVPVLLRPGQRVVVTGVMSTGRHQPGAPVLTSTPTAEQAPNRVTAASACTASD